MKDDAFEEEKVREQLNGLPDAGRLAFSWGCCARLFPTYERFRFASSGWGNQAPLVEALDSIWDCVRGEGLSKRQVKGLTSACESVVPPSDRFTSHYSTLAQDVVHAVCSVLDYVDSGDLGRLVNAARYPMDVVDMHVQESEAMDPHDPELEKRILSHPLMKQEIWRRTRDLTELARLDLRQDANRAQYAERAKSEDVLVVAEGFEAGRKRARMDAEKESRKQE
jgi:uncharacterized protein YjaG (DUF416 family)